MTLEEAKMLGRSWTTGHDTDLGGWRSVIAVLLARVEELESRGKPLKTIADIIRESEGHG